MQRSRLRSLFPALSALFCTLLLCSCTASYSPFTHAPTKPLENDQLEVEAGYNAVTIYPDNGDIVDYAIEDGLGANVRYGASDRVMLGLGGWIESLDLFSPPSGGAYLEGLYLIGPIDADDSFRGGVHARYSQLYAGDQDLVGHGVQGGGILWTPMFWGIRPVVSSEIGYGVRLNGNNNEVNSRDIDNVLLWTQSTGFGFELPLNLQLKAEWISTFNFVSPGQMNTGDVLWTGFGSVSLAWRLDL